MQKRILYFDKENTDRIEDYLFSIEDHLTRKDNKSCLELKNFSFINFVGNNYIYGDKPNILGPVLLEYIIKLNIEQTSEPRKLDTSNFKSFADDMSFINIELTSLTNRIADYYENVIVYISILPSSGPAPFGMDKNISIQFTIDTTEEERSELKKWIEKYTIPQNPIFDGNLFYDFSNSATTDELLTRRAFFSGDSKYKK